MIICITGLPGSGTSESATRFVREFARRGFHTVRYSTDWMRYILWPALRGDVAQMGREFTVEEITLTYNALYALYDALLALHPDLVIVAEGTYRSKLQRETLQQIALRHGADFVLVHVRAQEAIQLERLRIRLERREGGGPESYYTTKPEYEEPEGDVLRIENSGDFEALDKSVNSIVQLLVGKMAAQSETK